MQLSSQVLPNRLGHVLAFKRSSYRKLWHVLQTPQKRKSKLERAHLSLGLVFLLFFLNIKARCFYWLFMWPGTADDYNNIRQVSPQIWMILPEHWDNFNTLSGQNAWRVSICEVIGGFIFALCWDINTGPELLVFLFCFLLCFQHSLNLSGFLTFKRQKE